MILLNPTNEVKSEVLTVKVSPTQKKEFASEAADMQITNSEYLRMLIDSRHETIKLATLIGFVVKTTPDLYNIVTSLARQNGLSASAFIEGVLLKYIDGHKVINSVTMPSILVNNVNQTQSIGL